MDLHWIRAASVLILPVLFTAGCGEDPEAPEVPELPETTGDALWSYLQDVDYRSDWNLWPNKGEQYESGSDVHGAFLTMYVNDAALEAINDGASQMPDGAIIVKEGYDSDGAHINVTPMYKSDGYNPDGGDWFWAKYTPSGDVEAQGGGDTGCQSCHNSVADNDYIFTW